jgi:restriction endonuclease S subunit
VLSEGGFCAIVLPDGQLFNSKNFKKFREWLCDNVNILTIVKVPSGVFEHTNIKTNVLCFQKDGKTNNINFVKTNKKCNILQTIFNVSNVELKENGFSFDENEYIIESKIKYSAPVVKLGDVCDFMKKSKRQASYGKETGKYPFYTSSQICKKYVNEFDYENKCVIIGTGGTANIKMDENFSCSTDNFILKINNTSSVEYLFLYLKYNLKLLENGFKGVGLKHISKEYLKKIKIPLPILEIQNEIIEELSKLETSIQTLELRNEQLKNEKEQFRKYGLFEKINELLHGAEIKTIGDVMETKGGKGEYDRKQIKNGDYIYPYYDSNGIKGYVKNYLYENVNIITARNLSIGAVYLVNIKYYPSDHTINFTSKNKNTMLNVFFYNWLLFNNNKLIALSHGIKPGIRMSDVRKLNMPVPTLKKQEKLIALYEKKERNINKINDKIELNNKHIIKLKELGKNIIISFCN